MKTFLTVLLLAVLVVGMLAPPADAWGRHGYRYWNPLGILFAPLVLAGALVTAPFVIAGSAIAAATPPPAPVYAPPGPAYAPAPAYAAPVAAYRRPVAAYPPPPPPPPPPPAYQAPVAAYPSPAPMAAAAPAAPSYWYYCQNPAGYYPYVSECPGGWLTVTPR